jgi:hypothetical protein
MDAPEDALVFCDKSMMDMTYQIVPLMTRFFRAFCGWGRDMPKGCHAANKSNNCDPCWIRPVKVGIPGHCFMSAEYRCAS